MRKLLGINRISSSKLIAITCLTLIFFPLTVSSQLTPLGNEIHVNSYTTTQQITPALSMHSDGSFVVVWNSGDFVQNPVDDADVFGQRFNSVGGSLGDEFAVNQQTDRSQGRPSVTTLASGEFVVAWTSFAENPAAIWFRRFSSIGVPLGEELQVDASTTTSQYGPDIASGDSGEFIVTWEGIYQQTEPDIIGRRFGVSGLPIGSSFRINSITTGFEQSPCIAVAPTGEFVVAWDIWLVPGGSLHGQRFASNGAFVGSEFVVPADTAGRERWCDVAMAHDGRFVIAWADYPDEQPGSFRGRRFDALGAPIGAEFNGPASSGHPRLALLNDNRFIVTWTGPRNPDNDRLTYARLYSEDGVPDGQDQMVNEFTTGSGGSAVIAATKDGRGVAIAWNDYNDLVGYEIKARRLALPVFKDGFEDGTVSKWSE